MGARKWSRHLPPCAASTHPQPLPRRWMREAPRRAEQVSSLIFLGSWFLPFLYSLFPHHRTELLVNGCVGEIRIDGAGDTQSLGARRGPEFIQHCVDILGFYLVDRGIGMGIALHQLACQSIALRGLDIPDVHDLREMKVLVPLVVLVFTPCGGMAQHDHLVTSLTHR